MHPVDVSPGPQEGSPFVGSEEHAAPPESADNVLRRAGAGLREVRTVQTMLAAMIAWSITVAPAAFARSSPFEARMVAVLALPCGLAAPPLALARRSLGRHLGISVFLALVTLSWLLASTAIQPQRLDPVRAGIGAVAWGVFALSWRDRWPSGAPPQQPERDAPLLQARSRLPPVARAIVTIGAVAALALLFLAWRIREADRGLMAQIVAIACAIALSSAAADMSTGLGRRTHAPRRFTPHAVRPLLLLLAFAVAGAVIIALQQ